MAERDQIEEKASSPDGEGAEPTARSHLAADPTAVDPHDLFDEPRPVVGMVHLPPLPGSPRWGGDMDAVLERAGRDARALAEGGMDGVMVENFGDVPFHPDTAPPETVASLTRAVAAIRQEAGGRPVGVNVLRNDARSALGIAAATGASFIRVNVHTGAAWTDQGLLQGRAHDTLRCRRSLGVPVAILADVHVKHAVPPPGLSLEAAASDAWERGLADALVLSGARTGEGTAPEALDALRTSLPDARIWIGSGLRPETVSTLLLRADGAIVGSALQEGGRAGSPVDSERVQRFMEAVRRLRRTL